MADWTAFAAVEAASSPQLNAPASVVLATTGSSQWNATAFAGFSVVVVVLLLLLARLSQSMVSGTGPGTPTAPDERGHLERDVATDDDPAGEPPGADGPATDSVRGGGAARRRSDDSGAAPSAAVDDRSRPSATEETPRRPVTEGRSRRSTSGSAPRTDPRAPAHEAPEEGGATTPDATPTSDRNYAELRRFGSGELLANVLVTHGLFAGLIAGAAFYWAVPASALGVSLPTAGTVGWGVAVGLALYVANEVGEALAARLGIDQEETLREMLAPESRAGWALLLGGALPVVAVGEELIFRGVLVGALAAGLGLPIWGLAVASSVAFALGHGAQGTGGIVVTGLLGFALAAAFVVSESLLLVIVAHYVVNALEFVVHEGFGVEWTQVTRP